MTGGGRRVDLAAHRLFNAPKPGGNPLRVALDIGSRRVQHGRMDTDDTTNGHQPPSASNTNNVVALEALRNGPPTVSVAQAAQHLGVSRDLVYDMIRDGRLPALKLSPKRIRITAAVLLRMLDGIAS
jgi:excisionase family DNA binding protein